MRLMKLFLPILLVANMTGLNNNGVANLTAGWDSGKFVVLGNDGTTRLIEADGVANTVTVQGVTVTGGGAFDVTSLTASSYIVGSQKVTTFNTALTSFTPDTYAPGVYVLTAPVSPTNIPVTLVASATASNWREYTFYSDVGALGGISVVFPSNFTLVYNTTPEAWTKYPLGAFDFYDTATVQSNLTPAYLKVAHYNSGWVVLDYKGVIFSHS